MPPATKKDCSVIIFDLNIASKDLAKKALLKICSKKFFTASKDLTFLILMNSKDTKNYYAARYGEGYEHISYACEMPVLYKPHLINLIEEAETGTGANWVEAIEVANHCLEEQFSDIRGTVTKQILFITDLAEPVSDFDYAKLDEISEILKSTNTFLYIVGPDLAPSTMLSSAEDVRKWMVELNVTDENLKLAKTMVNVSSNGVICNLKIGVHLFFAFKNWGGSQPWNVPLSFGTKIELPASTVKVLKMGMLCKAVAKKGETVESVWVSAEDESLEIEFKDIINGIKLHEKFVEVLDNNMFKCNNPRNLGILCITDSSNVPEYLMRGDASYFVLPGESNEAKNAMTYLIKVLAEQEKYLIARRVYNKNFVPKFVALIPKPNYNPPCFALVSLPYADDVKCDYKEEKLNAAPKEIVSEEINNYLNSINGEKLLPLSINMMQDTNTDRLINKVTDKYLDKYLDLGEVDIDLSLQEMPEKPLEALKSVWPEREIIKGSKKDDEENHSSSDEMDWS